jgi:hypothetical protein
MKYIYYALLLSGLFLLLIKWKRLDNLVHLFAPIYIFTLLTEAGCDLYKIYFPYHINQTLDCFFLFLYYFLLLRKKAIRAVIVAGFVLYLLFFSLYFLRNPKYFFTFDPIDFVVEGVFITLFSVYYLINLYLNDDPVDLNENSHFWISIGNLFFYAGAAFFMGYAYTLIKKNPSLYVYLSYIVFFLNLLLYSLYIKAFLCPSPAKKQN